MNAYFDQSLQEHRAVAEQLTANVAQPFGTLLEACLKTIRQGGKIVFFGNGGSAADAQHLATELTVRFSVNRAPIAALALTTDTSALTAIGNDYNFDAIFARQVEALVTAHDTVIGISTSGNSANIIEGLKAAKAKGAVAAALSGGAGGKLPGLADPLICVPSTTTARIQEYHIFIGQVLCGALEQELGLVADAA